MTARKCPECARPMIDMGAYFEPPRKLNKRRWAAIRVIAEEGYKFRSEAMKIYIEENILGSKTSNSKSVKERIELLKKERENIEKKQRLDWEKNYWRKQK